MSAFTLVASAWVTVPSAVARAISARRSWLDSSKILWIAFLRSALTPRRSSFLSMVARTPSMRFSMRARYSSAFIGKEGASWWE